MTKFVEAGFVALTPRYRCVRLFTVMKIPPEAARKLVFEALFKHDGDRDKAAAGLGVARRTFDRWIRALSLYDEIDKMGWSRPGPPRGMPRGSSEIRMKILIEIRKADGYIEVPEVAEKVYGSDDRISCQKIWTALYDLKKQGVISQNERTGQYKILSDRKLANVPNDDD